FGLNWRNIKSEETMTIKFHYLVRGIIRIGDKFLLAHQVGADNTFLPGGHIGECERAEHALIRGIEEEIGKTAVIKRFVGAVEHVWTAASENNHEVNLLFEVEVPDLDPTSPPRSHEEHLEFLWATSSSLISHNLQPVALIECLSHWREEYEGYWETSI
ncbi:NUDIX domain-containing protein, partial [Candidatus Bipolaricaulota bacterium]|nr:NUDIX domain-containing protein [Candidatus Bipolaricaulota bacterium]